MAHHMKRILFVCTGNTFRSASAEYLLKHFLAKHHDDRFIVTSAGTKGNPYGVYKETQDQVAHYGGDMSRHKYKVLTQGMIDESDVIICMAEQHKKIVQEKFGRESFLFNDLAYDSPTDLKDDEEAYGEYKDLGTFVRETVDIIFEGIPRLYDKIKAMDL